MILEQTNKQKEEIEITAEDLVEDKLHRRRRNGCAFRCNDPQETNAINSVDLLRGTMPIW